jgi:hypothetical protein
LGKKAIHFLNVLTSIFLLLQAADELVVDRLVLGLAADGLA